MTTQEYKHSRLESWFLELLENRKLRDDYGLTAGVSDYDPVPWRAEFRRFPFGDALAVVLLPGQAEGGWHDGWRWYWGPEVEVGVIFAGGRFVDAEGGSVFRPRRQVGYAFVTGTHCVGYGPGTTWTEAWRRAAFPRKPAGGKPVYLEAVRATRVVCGESWADYRQVIAAGQIGWVSTDRAFWDLRSGTCSQERVRLTHGAEFSALTGELIEWRYPGERPELEI